MLRNIRGKKAALVLITLVLFLYAAGSAMAATMNLPSALKTVEAEAFSGNKAITRVTVNSQCTSIQERAFYGCSNLEVISIPKSVKTIGSQAFTGCNQLQILCYRNSAAHQYAVANRISYWLYDGAVFENSVQDGMGGITLYWTSAGDNTMYTVTRKTATSGYTVVGATSGTSLKVKAPTGTNYYYTVQPSLILPDGDLVAGVRSEPLDISAEIVWASQPAMSAAVQSGNSVMLSWKGVNPINEYTVYDLFEGQENEVGTTTGDTEIVLEEVEPGLHEYYVAGTYTKPNFSGLLQGGNTGAFVTVSDEPISILVEAQLQKPSLYFDDASLSFATKKEAATEYKLPVDIDVKWNPVAGADSFTFTLDQYNGSSFVNCLTVDNTQILGYTFAESMFEGLTAKTVYRFGIVANGKIASDISYSYFAVIPVNKSISLNATRWDHSKREGGQRTFTVASELDWTASCDADWISLTNDLQNNTLTVEMKYMFTTGTRNATVTVTNGENTATLMVNQQYATGSPELFWQGAELSTDPDSPTEIPAGGLVFQLTNKGASTTGLEWYYKQNNEYKYSFTYRIGSAVKTVDYAYTQLQNYGIIFSTGTELKIRVHGHIASYSSEYRVYESTGDAYEREYYIRLVEKGSQILVNGSSDSTISLIDEKRIELITTNMYTVTSDASWLSYQHDSYENRSEFLNVIAEGNYTGSERTGHLTFSTGKSTAVLTVIQPDMMPRLISPSDISQKEGSPTTIKNPYFSFTYMGTDYKWEYKDGSNWVLLYEDPYGGSVDSFRGAEYGDNFQNGKTYRLTIMGRKDNKATAYYIRRSNSTSSQFSLDVQYESIGAEPWSVKRNAKSSGAWSVSSHPSWLTVSPDSGSKGSNELTFKASRNTTNQERTGSIQFKVNGYVCAEYKVVQKAGSSIIVTAEDGTIIEDSSFFTHVDGDLSWIEILLYPDDISATVSTETDWISIDGKAETTHHKNRCFDLRFEQNTTGSPRTGSITITSGNKNRTFSISQDSYLGDIVVTSPSISKAYSSPSYLTNNGQGLTLKWKKINNAVSYQIDLIREDGISIIKKQAATSTSTQSTNIPAEWLDIEYMGIYNLNVRAVDAYGNYTISNYYFSCATGDVVYLSRKVSQEWSNIFDLPDSKDFKVSSSGPWTASANQAWISLSATSGNSGANLCISVSKNTGARRTGTVTVKSGSASATVIVTQCAALLTEPAISSPDLSGTTPTNPKTISIANDRLTISWVREPQAKDYRIKILTQQGGKGTVVAQSGWLENENSYTFSDYHFEAGQIYKLGFYRVLKYPQPEDKYEIKHYYFVIQPPESYIEISGSGYPTMHAGADGDAAYYRVKASGSYIATVSDWTWMQVTTSAVAERGAGDEEGGTYVGVSGSEFALSTLKNTTGATRRGTVTVTTPGGASKTIQVEQEPAYSRPALTSPSMGNSSATSKQFSPGSITLNWTAGENTTGEYTIRLERKSGTSSYSEVWRKSTVSRTLTIPASVLEENTYYRLIIKAVLNNSSNTVGSSYFFHVGSASELTVSGAADWTQAAFGGYIDISASAAGGAGGYMFAYSLYCDGNKVSESPWHTVKNYQFLPTATGQHTWKVRVDVKDSANAQKSWENTWQSADTNVISVSVASHYSASIDYTSQILKFGIVSGGAWTVTSTPEWISVTPSFGNSGTDISIAVDRNEGELRTGKITFKSASNVISDLTVTQGANPNPPTTATISGKLVNEDSTPISDGIVNVYEDNEMVGSATSNSNGVFSVTNLPIGRTYRIVAQALDYVFQPVFVTATRTVVNAGEITGERTTIGLIVNIEDHSIMVGEQLVAKVTAPDALAVRLVVDNIGYEEYPVYDGQIEVKRVFSSEGSRKVQFQTYVNGAWDMLSTAQTVIVSSKKPLDKPIVTAPSTGYTGENYSFTIGCVENASSYFVRVYGANGWLYTTMTFTDEEIKQNPTVTIPGSELLIDDTYGLSVIATGIGYSQSETTAEFTLQNRNYSVMLNTPETGGTYVVGDTFHIKATHSGGYLAICISGPNGDIWYPDNENHLTTVSPYTVDVPVASSGNYQIRAYVYAANIPAEQNKAIAASNASKLTVNGPNIKRVLIGSDTKQMTWIDDDDAFKAYITTNNAVEKVYVSESGVETEAVFDTQTGDYLRHYSYDLRNTSAGYHQLAIRAVDMDVRDSTNQYASDSTTREYYIAREVTPYSVYAKEKGSSIVSSPINGTLNAYIQGGEWLEPLTVTHDANDWVYLKTYSGQTGFVQKSKVSPTTPSTANGLVEILSPSDGSNVARNSDNTMHVIWRSGITFSDPYKVQIVITQNSITKKKEELSTLFDNSINVSSLPDGKYQVKVRVLNTANIYVESESVEFTLGKYDEQAVKAEKYKAWFKRQIYPTINTYLTFYAEESTSQTFLLSKVLELKPYIENGYLESNGVSFQIGSNNVHLFNGYSTSQWATEEEEERAQTDLAILGDTLKEESKRGNVVLNYDLDNISESISAKVDSKTREATVSTIFSAVETVYESVSVAIQAQNIANNAIETSKAKKFVKSVLESTYNTTKDMVTQTVKDYDIMLQFEAYKKEYTRALRETCSDYVDYLETTVFGGRGESSRKATYDMDRRELSAYQYIQAYRSISNRSDAEIEKNAVAALLTYASGNNASRRMLVKPDGTLNMNLLEAYSGDVSAYMVDYLKKPENWYDMFKRVLKTTFKDFLKSIKKDDGFALEEVESTAIAWIDALCVWDHDKQEFTFSVEALLKEIEETRTKWGLTATPEVLLDLLLESKVNDSYKAFFINDRRNGTGLSKEITAECNEVKNGFYEAIHDLVSDAWDLGKTADELIQNASEYIAQLHGKAAFEAYAAQMADTLTYRSLYRGKGKLIAYDWKWLETYNIEDLEVIRQSMITLINNDEMMFTYLRNMRTENEQADWRFRLYQKINDKKVYFEKEDYPSEEHIDNVKSALASYKQNLKNVPDDIKAILP